VESIAGNYESPEKVHADRELQTLVRQAVSRLGKTAGEMFVLRYYEGLANKEIAVLLETSPFVVGVVHGLAGSAAVTLLILPLIENAWWATCYLLVFGAATIATVYSTSFDELPYCPLHFDCTRAYCRPVFAVQV